MTPGNFQDLEISMAMILTIPMEFSMAHGNFQVLEIFRGPGNFHGPWKIPWPMENSMGGLMSGWTRGDQQQGMEKIPSKELHQLEIYQKL